MGRGGTQTCTACGKSFSWSVEGDVWPGGKDREDVQCPHCGHVTGTVMTSGYVATRPIEAG